MAESSLWFDTGRNKSTLFLSSVKSIELSSGQAMTVTTDDLKILFHFSTDYESIRQYSQQFRRITRGFTGMSFRKVDTKIEVGETNSDVLFSPPYLIRRKWFKHDCQCSFKTYCQLHDF